MSFRHYMSITFTGLLAIILIAGAGYAVAGEGTPNVYGKIPRSLQNIENKSGDIVGLAAVGHWRRVSRDVTAIADSWSTYKQTTSDNGVSQDMQRSFEAALSRLQRVSTADQAHQTMQAAHDLRAIAVDISDFYQPDFPSDIARLDILERQAMLDTAANHLHTAAGKLAKAEYVLNHLKPSIEAHKGAALARRFEENLALQFKALKAKDKSALTAHARNALELVERLETLYS